MDAPTPETPAATTLTPEHAGRGFVEAARGLWQDDRLEIAATILLAMSAVLSAWGAYQATRWSGEQADHYAESARLRAEAGGHGTMASRQIQIDVATFLSWSQAVAAKDQRLADFIRTRFRLEFKPPFEAWLATAPSDAQGLPSGTPFEQPGYKLAEQAKADDLLAEADVALARAQSDNQISDNFVLTAVLFASVFFFAGTAAKFRPHAIRWAMIAVAVVVFAIGLAVEFILPQNVGF